MKKIISLLLTVAMLMSMLGIVVTAEDGNAAVFYQGANRTTGNRFLDSYCYFNKDIDAVKRVSTSGAEHFGGYYFTQVFDFKVTDYGTGSDHLTDFTFSNDITKYHYGYSFTEKAFVVYDMYMPGQDPAKGYSVMAKMSYDLQLNTWYEMAIRFVDRTITIYLNGVEMLVCNLAEGYHSIGNDNYMSDWDWTVNNRPETLKNDLMMLNVIDVDMYLDNWTVYSGDYSIATDTASKTIVATDSDFASFNVDEKQSFSGWMHSDCGFSLAPNGGTAKVTYDRNAAATHTHEWVYSAEKSSVQHCLVPGYDLYECANGCGASEQRNYVAPAGHLPGYVDSVVIEATATQSGVEKRVCTREGCGKTYTTIVPLTDTTNGALHSYNNGGNTIYNGYMGVGNKNIMAVENGVTVEFDIMPVSHSEGKDFAAVGATLGGNGHTLWVGYKYNTNQFVITYNGEIVASSDKAFNNYEWQRWTIVHDNLEVRFYIDDALLLTADIDPDIFNLNRESGTVKKSDCYQFVFGTPATEIILDNIIVASPDFDLKTRAGVIYNNIDFNGDQEVVNGFVYDSATGNAANIFHAIMYNPNMGAGYKVEAYGRPMEAVTEIHQDRAYKLDSNYEKGSIYGYSQLHALSDGETGTDHMNLFVESMDLEFSYDFYVYDWCTDPELLKNGSAYIGSHVNSFGNGNDNNPYGNLFAGYDFIKQQVVIGSVGSQAGAAYGENTQYADYAVAAETWHNMTIKYAPDYGDASTEDDDVLVVSVYMDGNLIHSVSYDLAYVTVQYFIFFPNFIKGYFDNMTVKIDGVTYDDAVDFTNGVGAELAAMDFANGTDWSIADGGKPTHVYAEKIFPASCVTDGYTEYTCSCGGSFYTLYNLPATGHSYDEGVVTKEPTGSEKGEMTYTCTLCGDTYTEEIAKLFTYGDIDNDGDIDNADLSIFKRFLKGAKVTINTSAADVNVSGAVDNTDVSLLTRFLKGAKVTLG